MAAVIFEVILIAIACAKGAKAHAAAHLAARIILGLLAGPALRAFEGGDALAIQAMPLIEGWSVGSLVVLVLRRRRMRSERASASPVVGAQAPLALPSGPRESAPSRRATAVGSEKSQAAPQERERPRTGGKDAFR